MKIKLVLTDIDGRHRLTKKGGEGAFREFTELLLQQEDLLETAISLYLEATTSSKNL